MENNDMRMNQAQPNTGTPAENMPNAMNHGGHEMFDAHEVLGSVISMLDQYQLYVQHIQDPDLKNILNLQYTFTSELYSIIVESFQTGEKPRISTHVYKMTENNDVIFGLKPGQPKKPKQSPSEITDADVTSFMQGHVKGLASLMTMTAVEMTNPVLRRVVSDSVPNFIEMSYEIFLYQNRHGYYQVPQLAQQDMAQMLQSYAPAPANPLN
ncbi:spore coat protein [Thalassobacillus sp. CUG 92003]|uniref:spore coat protein n=1 Tax=Thalassobacillus sp. CUG 92003 TaxID=2736641 RepID=UPI0015E7C899|nr:spore coat protein [Thalassobacillus sp. CUG 92003]